MDKRTSVIQHNNSTYRGVNTAFVYDIAERFLLMTGHRVESIEPSYYYAFVNGGETLPDNAIAHTTLLNVTNQTSSATRLRNLFFGDITVSGARDWEQSHYLYNDFLVDEKQIIPNSAFGVTSMRHESVVYDDVFRYEMLMFTGLNMALRPGGNSFYPVHVNFCGWHIKVS